MTANLPREKVNQLPLDSGRRLRFVANQRRLDSSLGLRFVAS